MSTETGSHLDVNQPAVHRQRANLLLHFANNHGIHETALVAYLNDRFRTDRKGHLNHEDGWLAEITDLDESEMREVLAETKWKANRHELLTAMRRFKDAR